MSDRGDLAEICADSFSGADRAYREHYILADKILAAGWRPPARKIDTEEELEALAVGTVLVEGTTPPRTRSPPSGWQSCRESSTDSPTDGMSSPGTGHDRCLFPPPSCGSRVMTMSDPMTEVIYQAAFDRHVLIDRTDCEAVAAAARAHIGDEIARGAGHEVADREE